VYFSKAKTTQPQAKPDYRAHLGLIIAIIKN